MIPSPTKSRRASAIDVPEMAADTQDPTTRFSLRRWSKRKLEAARNEDSPRPVDNPAGGDAVRARDIAAPAMPAEMLESTPVAIAVPADAASSSAPDAGPRSPAAQSGAASANVGLPSLESLTIDSDYSPFMQPGVDENVKRSALRKLLRHPRFNVMDGLDVYIDDYSLPSPIEPALVRTLMQARYIFNPPQTRVNAEGHVEDVPDEPAEAADAGAAPVPQVAEAADARLPGDEIAAAIVEAPAETSTPGDASNDAGLPNPAAAQTQTKAIRR
jgi:hypothetical protein